ncbi:hypothetical protein SAY86_004506 [Trapa natans]|uniref:Subtilisin-like protease SBT1.1 n=1 Tax=Trapa natans TaxID=22666 RepID=A0AAN7MG94_TRANT|nr:hypothetical protein SAY86_004506 [Trapa natans]
MVATGALFLLLLASFQLISSSFSDQRTYIVHIDKAKTESERWHEQIIDSISEPSYSGTGAAKTQSADRPRPEILYVYESALSGFSVKLSEEQLESLNKVDGFLSATDDELLSLHTTHSPGFLGLNSGEGLWSASNLASDVIIGILDTGVWPEHVSFRDAGMPPVPPRWKGSCESGTNFSAASCNRKLIGARYYLKGYEMIAGKVNESVEFRSPRDRQGHGSHTASTAAGRPVEKASLFGFAKGSAVGMRYTSRLAIYKVCWQFGCASSDILAAMDQAVADGVDVLSLSLGGSSKPFYADNVAIASFGATQKGVFVSCSAGNSGPSPSTVSNAAPWIMTVAASYTDRSFPTKVKLGNGLVFEGASLYSGRATRQLPIVYNTSAGGRAKGVGYCLTGSLDPSLVKGKIVACERGMNSRTAKGEQVKLAGGEGMLLLNSDREKEELFADAHVLPATSLGATAADAVRKYANSSANPTVSISFQGTVYGSPAPAMAAFSSRGPSIVGPDVIKPDVTAPGVNVLAAWPPVVGPSLLKSDHRSVVFNIISGTSMSCPHVSGIAALLRSARGNWSVAAIKSALMTTAYTLDSKRAPITDFGSSSGLADPFTYGSGHVDPGRASDPGLIYDISTDDYLKYLCSLNYTASQLAIFVGKRSQTCPANKADAQSGDLNYPSFAVLFNRNARRRPAFTYERTVTNVGTAAGTYRVQVVEPKGVSVTVQPRTLVFKMLGEKLSYKVMFAALKKPSRATTGSTFGSISWSSGKYSVRSPIAVTWG